MDIAASAKLELVYNFCYLDLHARFEEVLLDPIFAGLLAPCGPPPLAARRRPWPPYQPDGRRTSSSTTVGKLRLSLRPYSASAWPGSRFIRRDVLALRSW